MMLFPLPWIQLPIWEFKFYPFLRAFSFLLKQNAGPLSLPPPSFVITAIMGILTSDLDLPAGLWHLGGQAPPLSFWRLEYYLAHSRHTICTNGWSNEVCETKTVAKLRKSIVYKSLKLLALSVVLPTALPERIWCYSVCADNGIDQLSTGQRWHCL